MIESIPLACSDELAAVEFSAALRWEGNPACIHCGSVEVYKMPNSKTDQRNKRFLWRCRDCGRQYTVGVRQAAHV